eukprot:CAMPEP_0185168740 /NCGR_PEP_ID=MMETSP1139-20130426/16296_2 /TAXON_ID=298111 /ORGANISM="Pavlova sp., Strain CCMP459" /LENGTH=113 /DNA_ID=CAMNT_0027734259 /DNA_START=245 /DNA_END=583 /DNA_ORIENTATION=-
MMASFMEDTCETTPPDALNSLHFAKWGVSLWNFTASSLTYTSYSLNFVGMPWSRSTSNRRQPPFSRSREPIASASITSRKSSIRSGAISSSTEMATGGEPEDADMRKALLEAP